MNNLESIIQKIGLRASGAERFLVAIAGPPGSGKSTFATKLVARLGPSAAVLPMDGFHLDNATLQQLGLLERKGAPETFDAEAFIDLVRAIRQQSRISYPTFNRELDKVIPKGETLEESSKIIVIEGNYLLLRTPPWSELFTLFDLTIYLDVAPEELETRLVQRWLDYGLSKPDAITRARRNDLRNAEIVANNSRAPDFTLEAVDKGSAGAR